MRVLLALAPLLLIAACMPEGQPRLHEIVLYGAENSRLTYLYGTTTSLRLGDREVTLNRGAVVTEDPLMLREALTIDGTPYLQERVEPLLVVPTEVRGIQRSSDLRVSVNRDTGPVLYFDGSMWFTLLGDGRSGVDVRVVPKPSHNGLRGLGELTRNEADALMRYLEAGGPVAVTLLDEVPAPARVADGVSEYRRTAFYLQRDFERMPAAVQPPREELVWEVMAEGRQATGFDQEQFFAIRDQDRLRTLWNQAHGSMLQVPVVPTVDFRRETVVAIFLGTRSTGGYSVEVERALVEGTDVVVDVRLVEPDPGAITTQAITSPWVMVRLLRGGIDTVWIREAGSNRILGVGQSGR